MKNKTSLDPIKAKIQELCPDVMELNFGCVVAAKGHTLRYIGFDSGQHCLLMDTGALLFVDRIGEVEILGSPITLAVVLRAMEKSNDGFALKLHTIHDSFFFQENTPAWNLEHDNYDQQSEETKQFVGSLLGV